jgi:hypothetical protein
VSDLFDAAAARAPHRSNREEGGSGTQRRNDHVGGASGREKLGELGDQPPGHVEPIRTSVEREVHPSVRVPILRARRKVRGVREDPVEVGEAGAEVRAHPADHEPRGARPLHEGRER